MFSPKSEDCLTQQQADDVIEVIRTKEQKLVEAYLELLGLPQLEIDEKNLTIAHVVVSAQHFLAKGCFNAYLARSRSHFETRVFICLVLAVAKW